MVKTNKNWKAMSDMAILKTLGEFVKHHRLEHNKTQGQLADEAGINRSTLQEFEQGKRSTTLTLIQLMRALNQLHLFELFQIQNQLSPIQLAELQQNKRKRASKNRKIDKKPKSDW